MDLIEASKIGNLERVKELISKGADIHYNDDEVLRTASNNGHFEIVKFLVLNGANVHGGDDIVGFKGHKVEALPIDEVLVIMEERGHFIQK